MNTPLRLSRAAFAALLSILGSAAHADFATGDVYLVSAALPASGGTTTPGIYRHSPGGGPAGLWIPLPNGSFGPGTIVSANGATYDPHRDRILVTLLNGGSLGTVDESGALGTIPVPSEDYPLAVAGPNGIIYLVNSLRVTYLDAANTAHDLLDGGGNQVAVSSLGLVTMSSGLYDVGTQTLIVAGANTTKTRFARIPLDASGTQVPVAPSYVERDLIAGIGEIVAGLSAGPGGSLFVTIDINAVGNHPLLQTIDPVNFTPAVFATTSGFNNAGLTTGTWLAASGSGLVLDTSADVIRSFAPGEIGVGTIVATGASSTGGSGEAARMMSIGTTINGPLTVPGDLDGDGQVGAADLALLLGGWGTCRNCESCEGDLDGDCDVGAPDLAILLGTWD